MRKKALITAGIVGVAAIFIGIGVFNTLRQQQASKTPKNAFPVEIEQPHKEDIVTKVTAKGAVELVKKNTVYATSQGKIKTLFVKVGDGVKKGQVLLEYDEKGLEDLNNQLEEANLSLKAAELSLESVTLPPTQAEITAAESKVKTAEKNVSDLEYQRTQQITTIDQLNRDIKAAEKKHEEALAKKETTTKKAVEDVEYQISLQDTQIAQLKRDIESTQKKYDETLVKKETTMKKAVEDVEYQISQQDAQIAQTERDVELTESKYNDTKALVEKGVLAKRELDSLEQSLTALKDKLETTQTQRLKTLKMLNDKEELDAVLIVKKELDSLSETLKTLKDNLGTAQKQRDKAAKSLNDKEELDAVLVVKREIDTLADTIKTLKDQLNSAQLQLNKVIESIQSARETVDSAKKEYNSLSNKQTEPTVVNRTEQQQIQVDQATLRVEQIKKKIDEFKLQEVSDVEGAIMQIYTQEGDNSVVGKQLMEVADLSFGNLVIKVNIPENRTSSIAAGQKVELSGEALGKNTYEGVISKVYPIAEKKQIGNSVETVTTVEVSLLEENEHIKPGYNIETSIVTNTLQDAVVIPIMATRTDEDGKDFVYVMNEDFSVSKREITLGEYSNIYVQASGIELEDKVIITNAPQVVEGSYVRPMTMPGEEGK